MARGEEEKIVVGPDTGDGAGSSEGREGVGAIAARGEKVAGGGAPGVAGDFHVDGADATGAEREGCTLEGGEVVAL